MAQLRQDYPLFAQLNTEVLILGPDNPFTYKRHWEQDKMPAVGLADIKSRVADLYYQEVNLIRLGRMPAEFIIDPNGIVQYAHYGKSMSDIPSNSSILEILKQLQQTS